MQDRLEEEKTWCYFLESYDGEVLDFKTMTEPEAILANAERDDAARWHPCIDDRNEALYVWGY